jgi:hypothetical protein
MWVAGDNPSTDDPAANSLVTGRELRAALRMHATVTLIGPQEKRPRNSHLPRKPERETAGHRHMPTHATSG